METTLEVIYECEEQDQSSSSAPFEQETWIADSRYQMQTLDKKLHERDTPLTWPLLETIERLQ